jgi:hypothetical protein
MPAKKGVKGFVSNAELNNSSILNMPVMDTVTLDLNDIPVGMNNNLEMSLKNKMLRTDFRAAYYPTDNSILGNPNHTEEGFRFKIQDCDAWMHYSVGVGHMATYGMSNETVKNGFEFVDDPDAQDAEAIKNKKITKDFRQSGFINMLKKWRAYDLGMGFGFAVGYWTANDLKIMDTAPPKRFPRSFEVINPLYLQPTGTTLTKSNRLDYNEEIWEFTGGVINNVTEIHKDRVFVLRTNEISGSWRGLTTFDPAKESMLGYYNALIYLRRGIQDWGDTVPIIKYGNKWPTIEEAKKIISVLNYMEMNGKMQIPLEASIEFKPTNIGKGIKDAVEQYKEDLSGLWRIPKNQLFGRSEGGGLTSGPAKISKDDFYERIGSDQLELNHPIMKQFIWKYYPDTDNYWPRWHLNVYKTDEQRLIEESIYLDNIKRRLEIEKLQFELNVAKSDLQFMQNNSPAGGTPDTDVKNKKSSPRASEPENSDIQKLLTKRGDED